MKKKKIGPRGKLCQVSRGAPNEQLYEGSLATLGSPHIVPIAPAPPPAPAPLPDKGKPASNVEPTGTAIQSSRVCC